MLPTRFLAAQAASFAGTAADFFVTIVAVEVLHLHYLPAVVAGNVAGGGLNFYLGRHYVFGAGRQGLPGQATRYLLVWLGSLLLNTGGVYLLVQGLRLPYLLSKIGVSLLVGFGFNYVLQQKFVFRKP
ncbi:GtrA family protein [uncultured Hymenobacter sp.]|uniref:GtrA family protein n=1 Tax=uncultured Hymenobacter sp. TaxID=170016 RepID=UPI0035CA52B4